MSKTDENPFATYDYKETAEYKLHRRTMERLDAMSDEEKVQTLVDAGILTEDLELTKRYGGDAPNPEDD